MFVTGLMALQLTSCDSGGQENEPPGSGPSLTQTAAGQTSPEFRDGSVFSGAIGYSAKLSSEWSAFPTASLADGQQDTFSTQVAGATLPASIQVRCFRAIDEGARIQAILTETSRAHPESTATPTRSVTVDGHEAVSVVYLAGTPPLEVEREDVVFASERCAWTISLVSPPGLRDALLAEFEEFLSTFRAEP
jgi:hypothetical protein